MISGIVSANLEAIIPLLVIGPGGQEMVDAILDTGFDGSLTLPAILIARLQLPWRRRGRVVLADGSESYFDVYEGGVDWDGQLIPIAIDAVNTVPLIGMSLLGGFELTMQIRAQGEVNLISLP